MEGYTEMQHQLKIHVDLGVRRQERKIDFADAAVGRDKVIPTAAIFPQKCGRWHFENAAGREKPVKPRPVDSILGLHRARC